MRTERDEIYEVVKEYFKTFDNKNGYVDKQLLKLKSMYDKGQASSTFLKTIHPVARNYLIINKLSLNAKKSLSGILI